MTISKKTRNRNRPAALFGIVVAACITFWPSLGLAACNQLRLRDVSRVDWSGGNGNGYEVFDLIRSIEQFSFRVSKSSGVCDYVVALSANGSGGAWRQLTKSIDALDYNIYTSASGSTAVGSLPGASAQEVLGGAFTGTGREEDSVSMHLVVEPGQVVPRGNYTGAMDVILYEGTLASATEVERANLSVKAVVAEIVEISLVETSQPFDPFDDGQIVDFGQTLGPATLGFDMRIRGNAGFDVRFKSNNQGQMENLTDNKLDGIPYVFSVNGIPNAFDSAGQVKVALKPSGTVTAVSGEAFPVDFSIGDISNYMATSYEDTMTITVIAK